MRFLADQNVEVPILRALRQAGHDVAIVTDRDARLKDDAVLRWAEDEGRILITNDKDFGELAFLQRWATVGILLMRLPLATGVQKAVRLLEEIDRQGERLLGSFTVVAVEATRMRPLGK